MLIFIISVKIVSGITSRDSCRAIIFENLHPAGCDIEVEFLREVSQRFLHRGGLRKRPQRCVLCVRSASGERHWHCGTWREVRRSRHVQGQRQRCRTERLHCLLTARTNPVSSHPLCPAGLLPLQAEAAGSQQSWVPQGQDSGWATAATQVSRGKAKRASSKPRCAAVRRRFAAPGCATSLLPCWGGSPRPVMPLKKSRQKLKQRRQRSRVLFFFFF